jgi:purine catabolism regulator
MLESAKSALSVQMMRSFIRFRFETRTLSELFFDVVERRWRDESDIQQRAKRLDIDADIEQQMIIIDFSEGSKKSSKLPINLSQNVARILQRASITSTVIPIDHGLLCLVPFEGEQSSGRIAKVMRQITEGLTHYLDREPIAIISTRCRKLVDYPEVWNRCRRMIDIAKTFGRTGPLSNQDFGPMPILIAAVGGEDIQAFVKDSVGAMVTHDEQHRTSYLETISTYLNENCRAQACADAMEIHVTTLRYRLMRIQEMFGVDLESPERRFAFELAIRLQKVMSN